MKRTTTPLFWSMSGLAFYAALLQFFFFKADTPSAPAAPLIGTNDGRSICNARTLDISCENNAANTIDLDILTTFPNFPFPADLANASCPAGFQTAWVTFTLTPNSETEWRREVMMNQTAHWALYRAATVGSCDSTQFTFVACGEQTMGPWDDFPDEDITTETTYFLAMYAPEDLDEDLNDLNVKLRKCGQDNEVDPCDASAGTLMADVSSICEGGAVDFDTMGVNGTPTFVIFQNDSVAASVATLAQLETYITGADPGEYCVYVIAYTGELNDGCENILGFTLEQILENCLDDVCYDISQQVCITVNAPPVASITGADTLCVGSTLDLAGSPADQSNANYGVSWSASGGNAVITINNAGVVTAVGSGQSTVTYIVTDLATGCADTATATIVVNSAPVLTLTGPDDSCEDDGSTLTVTITVTGGTAPYTISFGHTRTYVGEDCEPLATGPAAIVVDQDGVYTVSFTGAGAGDYVFNASVTDAIGCSDTTETVDFEINAKPVGQNRTKTISNCDTVRVNLQALINCNLASTFSWYSVASVGSSVAYNNPNVLGETVNPAGTSSTIKDALTNISNVAQNIIYRVVPTSVDGGCVGDPFYITVTVRPRTQAACVACMDQVNVSLDSKCTFKVLPEHVIDFSRCENGRVLQDALEVVISGSNSNLITCAGTYSYVVKLKKEYEQCFIFDPCWGKITAEDKRAPELVCAPADVTLDCYDVNYVLNNRLTIGNYGAFASPRPAATGNQTINNAEGVAGTGDNCQLGLIPPGLANDNIKNLGYAYFRDNCRECGCRVTLKWTDKVVYYACTDTAFTRHGYYAKIERQWVATDCNGMSSSYVQDIFFKRPPLSAFVFKDQKKEGKYDQVVTYNSCTPDKSLIKKEDVTPYHCSYFNTSANPRCLYIDQVECNYSVSIKDTEFPICGGKGVKIDREIFVFDWCAGGIVDTFHVLIKIGDFEAPTAEYAHGAPYDISTGPMDCTAAIPVTPAGIKANFGVTIKDNCNLGNLSVKVYTKDRYVKGILVHEGSENPLCKIEEQEPKARTQAELRGDNDSYRLKECTKDQICWDPIDYAVMNGMMIGLPVGKHLMVIEASDGCYNASTICFIFEVKDKIAPVMKCDDDLHVTLSNANGYTNGYAQVSAADIDEGSWDNCKLAWIAVRRNVPASCEASFVQKGYDSNGNGRLDAAPFDHPKDAPANFDWSTVDGVDNNGDGDIRDFGEFVATKGGKKMTPLLDFVEFFCCDLTERVTVELWGADTADDPKTLADETNYNYCWMDLLIEDKVAPTCIAPWDVTIDCDDKNIALIDDKVASSKIWGDVTITTGNDCGALDTVYTTTKTLKCGYGKIVRNWALTKQTAKGPITINCSQTIWIRPIHQYNIRFPKDASTDCKTPTPDTVIVDELACDLLAVNVSNKRYDASDDECYKIFRTYTVINWCAYDDKCGDPMAAGNVFVVDRGLFGNNGAAPIFVLVRDDDRDLNEEFYLSTNLVPNEPLASNGRSGDYHVFGDGDRNGGDSGTGYRSTDYATYAAGLPVSNPAKVNSMPYCEDYDLSTDYFQDWEYYHSFMYTQIIKVYDDVRPVVTAPAAEFCIREGSDCLADIKMVVSATDNCADKLSLETQYLMIAPFQTTDAGKMILYSTPRWSTKPVAGTSNQFEISVTNIPEGKHDLIVVVRDECGNLSVATRIPFTVKDCKGPAPICINGLSTELMSDGNGGGMMAVWASDFVASKIYDCNGQGPETNGNLKLVTKYSINRVGEPVVSTQTGINLTCADKGKVVLVELHAWDNAGNHDFCVTYVEVQDNRSVCPTGNPVTQGSIAGNISTESSAKLQDAIITLSGGASMTYTTQSNGSFSFNNLTKGYDFTVTPQLDKNHINGVSTFDLVLIQKHILGVQALNSPYKMIAADVNNSKSISTLDMIQLRKLILNIDTHFANNTSWRFIDGTYQFPDLNNPWSAAFPEVVNVNDLAGDVRANFIAIKIGDVNGSATVNGASSAELRSGKSMILNAEEQSFQAGQVIQVPVKLKATEAIQGWQYTLKWDASVLSLEGLDYDLVKAEQTGVFADRGMLTTSWNDRNANLKAEEVLYTLTLRAKQAGILSQSLRLNSSLTTAEAYNAQDEVIGVQLSFGQTQLNEEYALEQNNPNPFAEETSIGFYLPKASSAVLSIRDVKGSLVYQVKGNYAKGRNLITLNKTQLQSSGVFYYTLQTDEFTETRKMILTSK